MFLARLDDKQILYFGMAHIQQMAPFIQKTNLQFLDPPRVFASIGHNTCQPVVGLRSSAIQGCAQHDEIIPMSGKTAATHAFFIRRKHDNYSNRYNDENRSWSADQQLLSPQCIATLLRAAERTNLCRCFDRFGTKRADFVWYAVSHNLPHVAFFHGCNGGGSNAGIGGGAFGIRNQSPK